MKKSVLRIKLHVHGSNKNRRVEEPYSVRYDPEDDVKSLTQHLSICLEVKVTALLKKNGKQVDRTKSLADNNISEGDVLTAQAYSKLPRSKKEKKVNVKLLAGESATIEIRDHSSPQEVLRHKLQDITGYPAEMILLQCICTSKPGDYYAMKIKTPYKKPTVTRNVQENQQETDSSSCQVDNTSCLETLKLEHIPTTTSISDTSMEEKSHSVDQNSVIEKRDIHTQTSPIIFEENVSTKKESIDEQNKLSQKLTGRDVSDVNEVLRKLSKIELHGVGLRLGLSQRRLITMNKDLMPSEVAESWINRDDHVNETPCWEVLFMALERNGKNGLVKDVMDYLDV